jgi:hypothetical protein
MSSQFAVARQRQRDVEHEVSMRQIEHDARRLRGRKFVPMHRGANCRRQFHTDV